MEQKKIVNVECDKVGKRAHNIGVCIHYSVRGPKVVVLSCTKVQQLVHTTFAPAEKRWRHCYNNRRCEYLEGES